MGFNYRANEFLLQQNWLRFERSVVTSGTTSPTFGFRTDWILPGSDYRFTLPRGILNEQLTENDGEPATYGIDPVQFYGEAYLPTVGRGLDVKVGRFFAPYGVETIDTISTPFVSRAYTFIYNPFTQTGILTATALSSAWTLTLGFTLGNDVFIDPASEPTLDVGIKWSGNGGRDTVAFLAILGEGRFNTAENFNNPNIFDVVYVHTFNPRLTYSLDALFGYQLDVPDIGTATWFGIVNYLSYKCTPRLTANARLEFFDDIDGNRTGFKGLYIAPTAGLSLQLRKDIIFRPEIRFDYNNESRPFEDRHGLFTAAADVILRW
jgi:hypothetical protein